MKKLLIILSMSLLLLTGCKANENFDVYDERFVVTPLSGPTTIETIFLIYDTENDQEYLFVKCFNAGGLTRLEAAE